MKKNYEELINELVEIEMSESSHDDSPEDYNSKLEFYLSNATLDSYIEYVKDNHKATAEDAEKIQADVIAEIKKRYEAIQLVAAINGKKGGSVKSERKAKASAENGKLGGRPPMQTYYSVEYSVWGSDRTKTAWFDNREEAEEFAAHDYRDNPVSHRTSKLDKIAEYDKLVAITNYERKNK